MENDMRSFVENGRDWEEMSVKDIPGMFIVKLPATKTKPAMLSVKINPVDDKGRPLKRKGIFVSTVKLANSLAAALENESVIHVISNVEKINASRIPEKKYLDLEK